MQCTVQIEEMFWTEALHLETKRNSTGSMGSLYMLFILPSPYLKYLSNFVKIAQKKDIHFCIQRLRRGS